MILKQVCEFFDIPATKDSLIFHPLEHLAFNKYQVGRSEPEGLLGLDQVPLPEYTPLDPCMARCEVQQPRNHWPGVEPQGQRAAQEPSKQVNLQMAPGPAETHPSQN